MEPSKQQLQFSSLFRTVVLSTNSNWISSEEGDYIVIEIEKQLNSSVHYTHPSAQQLAILRFQRAWDLLSFDELQKAYGEVVSYFYQMIERQPQELEFQRGDRSEKSKQMERSIIMQAEYSDPLRPPSNHSHLHQQQEHSRKQYASSNYEPVLLSRTIKQQHYQPENIPEQTDTNFFGLFSCCTNPKVEPDVYFPEVVTPRPVAESRRRDEPYMSEIRMKSRQNQPINIFHDHLVSQKLSQSRWTTHV